MKSCAQSVILFERLSRKLPIALQQGKGYFIFDSNGVRFVTADSDDEDATLAEDRSVWALIDDTPLHEFDSPWTRDWLVIWMVPPTRHRECSRWQKEQNAEVWHMGDWGWE